MKIVHICLCGPVTDDWNYQDNLLSKYHVKLGHEVSLITSKWIWGSNGKLLKTDKQDYFNNDQVRMIRLDIKGNKPFHSKFKKYKGISDIIEKINPEILFVHGCQFLDIRQIVKYIKKNPKVKVFVDNHADFSNSATSWLSKNILHKVIWKYHAQLILPYTKKFYGVLPARVDFLVDVYKLPKDKVELLVMGADDDLVKKANNPEVIKNIREKYNIAPDDFLIMTGGKIDLGKLQIILLMQAVQEIKKENVKLIVFGSVIDELKQEVNRLSDGTKVQYIAWVDAKDTYSYFASANLVIFPSLHSVFWEQVVGLGVPCIFNKIKGFDHIDLNGNCSFIDGNNKCEMIESINFLVNNPDKLTFMKKVASEKGIDKFSYKKIAEQSIS